MGPRRVGPRGKSWLGAFLVLGSRGSMGHLTLDYQALHAEDSQLRGFLEVVLPPPS